MCAYHRPTRPSSAPACTHNCIFRIAPAARSFAAILKRTSSALERSSRTLLAELEVDNSAQELLPGSYAQAIWKACA